MSDIVVVGSLNADFVVNSERVPVAGETVIGTSLESYCGGKGANQAYAAAKLGGSVSMLGRVGEDADGLRQIENLSAVGVCIDGIQKVKDVATGSAFVVVEASGENRAIVIPGTNGTYGAKEFAEHESKLEGARYLLLQLETTLEATVAGLKAARRYNVTTILDPAPAQPLDRETLGLVDFLTPNLSELRALTGESLADVEDEKSIVRAARRLIEAGAGKVVAKLGAHGAMVVESDSAYRVAGYKVKAVDTTAAGDCFNAAFAVALCRGEGDLEAVRFACAAAAVAVTRPGAQQGMPSLLEVQAFLGEV